MVVGVVLISVAAFVAAAVTRSWVAIVMVTAAWPLYFAGLLAGAWGHGVGESWQYGALLLTGASAAGGLLGMAVGRALSGGRGP